MDSRNFVGRQWKEAHPEGTVAEFEAHYKEVCKAPEKKVRVIVWCRYQLGLQKLTVLSVGFRRGSQEYGKRVHPVL